MICGPLLMPLCPVPGCESAGAGGSEPAQTASHSTLIKKDPADFQVALAKLMSPFQARSRLLFPCWLLLLLPCLKWALHASAQSQTAYPTNHSQADWGLHQISEGNHNKIKSTQYSRLFVKVLMMAGGVFYNKELISTCLIFLMQCIPFSYTTRNVLRGERISNAILCHFFCEQFLSRRALDISCLSPVVRVSCAARQLPSSCLKLDGGSACSRAWTNITAEQSAPKLQLLLFAFDMEMRGNGAWHPGRVPSRLVCLKSLNGFFKKKKNSCLLMLLFHASSKIMPAAVVV